METYLCKICNVTFARSLSLDRHNKVIHKTPLSIKQLEDSSSTKSESKTYIDYSGLDLSLMRKINALLGIPLPLDIQQSDQSHLTQSQSEESKDLEKVQSVHVKDPDNEIPEIPIHHHNPIVSLTPVTKYQNPEETPKTRLRLKTKKRLVFPTKRNKIIDIKTRIKCDKCGKDFSQPYILNDHVKSAHSNTFYSCEHCGKLLAYKWNLPRHMADVHGQKVSNDQIFKQFKIIKKSPKKLGIEKTKKSGSFKCHAIGCDKTFNQKESVRRHYMGFHKNRRFNCDQCDREFMEK